MKILFSTLVVCLTLQLVSGGVTAKTRNLVLKETPDLQFGQVNPVLLGDSIIYQTQDENISSLWSFNTQTNEKIKIFTGELSRFTFAKKYIYVIDDFAYFVSGENSNYLFWKTDGSLSGTTALNSPTFYPYHSIINEYLFTWSGQGTLFSTDGNEVIEHAIEYPAVTTICPFGNNDIIAVINEYNSEDTAIVRSKQGVISTLSSDFSTQFEVREGNSFNLEGVCHILATDFNNNLKEWFVVPEEGPISLMSEQIELANIFRIFPYKDRIYVYASSAQSGYVYSLFRLNSDLTGFDAQYVLNEDFAFTNQMSLTEDYIIVQSTTPTASPPVNLIYYLDANLQQNESLGGLNQSVPTAYPTADGEFFAFSSVSTYSETIDQNNSNPLVITDSFVSEVITNQQSTEVFLKLTDRSSQKQSIVKVADIPDINDSTAGIWHDPSIKNQGLVINKGQRTDGSDYLFVSVYTQQNGQPLWLAGVSNIELPQQEITIQLTRYEGAGFFEHTIPTESVWGNVTLKMTGCNAIQATFDAVIGGVTVIDLQRIENTLFNHLCSD